MKLISVCGVSKSGKTTCCEVIIAGLKARGFSVGSIKSIHAESFAMDVPGTNTHRHHAAGAEPVVALGLNETDILYHSRLPLDRLLPFFDTDFLIIEGLFEASLPKILTGHTREDIFERMDDTVVAISGRAAALFPDGHNGLPVIDPLLEPDKLIHFVLEAAKTPEHIPSGGGISLKIGGQNVPMVPFVKATLENIIRGYVSELRGYEKDESIEVVIR